MIRRFCPESFQDLVGEDLESKTPKVILFRLEGVSDNLTKYLSDTIATDMPQLSTAQELEALENNAHVILTHAQAFLELSKALSVSDLLKDSKNILDEHMLSMHSHLTSFEEFHRQLMDIPAGDPRAAAELQRMIKSLDAIGIEQRCILSNSQKFTRMPSSPGKQAYVSMVKEGTGFREGQYETIKGPFKPSRPINVEAPPIPARAAQVDQDSSDDDEPTDLRSSVSSSRSRSRTGSDTVVLSGWMTKRGAKRKTWLRRFFVITTSGHLCYYPDESCSEEKNRLELGPMCSILERAECNISDWPSLATIVPPRNCFALKTPVRTLYVVCADSENLGPSELLESNAALWKQRMCVPQ